MDTNKLRFLSSLVDKLENEGNIIEANVVHNLFMKQASEFDKDYRVKFPMNLNQALDEFDADSKYDTVKENVKQTRQLMENKVGYLCGYIKNYLEKINTMQLDEFTTTRIKGLIQIYGDMVKYLNMVKNSV